MFCETINSASGPTCSLCCSVVFKRHFLVRLARLKLTIGSCRFTRCWNVSLLRLRTPALRRQTIRREYRALTVLDSKRTILKFRFNILKIARTTRRLGASLRRGTIVCCRHCQEPAMADRGDYLRLLPSARTAVPPIKDAHFPC